MIKIMFKPFFKKYFGLFVSMVFVSMLAIAILCAFASTLANLQKEYKRYISEYQNVDAIFKTNLVKRENLESITQVEGVEKVDFRLTMDSRMQKDDGRVITSRIYTFNESENVIFKRYVMERIDPKPNAVNASIVRKFAKNNDLKIGDEIKIGYFKTYITLYINEIIETPEAIQARANDYVWSDATDFGYVYINELELDRGLKELADQIDAKIQESDEFRQYYESAVAIIGYDIPDLADKFLIGNDYASKYTNQLMIKAKEGYTQEQVVNNVNRYLEDNGVTIKSKSEAHNLFYILYIENCIRQLRIASVFLPVFFYFVTMIVIGLFINQIIQSMTKEIGVMMSIGVGFRDIQSIFLLFTFLMGIASSVFGVAIGFLVNSKLALVMREAYSMPAIPLALNPLICSSACVALVIFSEIATLFSCRGILHITPKDATISNEAKRKNLPEWLNRFIEKAPMNIKLGVNSMAQNFKRFFVSSFSIFASFVIIIITLFFFVSKTKLVYQSVEFRLKYDAQTYFTNKLTDEDIQKIDASASITSYEDCYYTYVQAVNGKQSAYLECVAIDAASTKNIVNIPDHKGTGTLKIEAEGLILPRTAAKELKVKKGDYVTINNKQIKVVAISDQYFHPITYLSKSQMDLITDQYVSSVLINTNDEDALLEFLDDTYAGSLTVFTHNLNRDLSGLFDSINIFIYIMIGFAFGMGFIILVIMSQNALMEQKRQLTVLRAIGFTIKNVSDVWTLQSVSELLLASIFAIPVGYLATIILFTMSSSVSQAYPRIFSIPAVLIGFAFILFIIVATHAISMLTIRRWNIADNTRSRE